MDLASMLFGNGMFWFLCTVAAGLMLWMHYTMWPLVRALAVGLNTIVMVMMVGGWVFPVYFHTWEPAFFNLGPHWTVPMLLWMFAGAGMVVGVKK